MIKCLTPPIVDLNSHSLSSVKQIDSPNCDARPNNEAPSLLVVHGISLPPNQFGGKGVEQLFTNQLDPDEHPFYKEIEGVRVSAHLFIRRDGEIIQFVPFNQRAWHAGQSEFMGRSHCNDFSIGIELEGTDDQAYTEIQYTQLANAIKAIQIAYPKISSNHLVGHSDIAPGRKTDPGECFEWKKLSDLLA